MKIYFAGSIRGGRDDREVYLSIIKYLGKYGQVLTEHIGNEKLTSNGEIELSDEQIYLRDVSWIEESDMIIAEISTPSLGVGYEIGKAESLGKKILCLYRNQENKRASAMLTGNNMAELIRYDSMEELILSIDTFFMNYGTIQSN